MESIFLQMDLEVNKNVNIVNSSSAVWCENKNEVVLVMPMVLVEKN